MIARSDMLDEGTRRDQGCCILIVRCRYHHHGHGEIPNGYLDHIIENEGRVGNAQVKDLHTGVEGSEGGECGDSEPIWGVYGS